MLWSKIKMKFLCCNWHYSKHISFLKSVISWNITLLYRLQSLSKTTSYMGDFQGCCYFWLFCRKFSAMIFQIELDTFNWHDKLWAGCLESPPPPALMLSEELLWPEKADFLLQAAGMTSQHWLQGIGTNSCSQASSWWTAEKDFLKKPPITAE